MDDGVVEIGEEQRERREELRRLTVRFFVAVGLDLFTGVCKRAAGFDSSDPDSGTENGHVAFYWASKFNRVAHLWFMFVISQIVLSTVVLARRMRSLRVDCDIQLMLGFICVMISLSFMAYLRWFV